MQGPQQCLYPYGYKRFCKISFEPKSINRDVSETDTERREKLILQKTN